MRGILVPLAAITVLTLAGCGGDNTSTFVLQSGSPAATGSESTTASASASAAALASPSLPNTAATPMADGSRIIIDSPDASTTISSPVEVSGTASVDKGAVVAVVLDAAGNELGRGTTSAAAAKPDFGHYDVSVTFSGASSGTKGKIRVFGVKPSDGTTPTYFYFITVTFS